VIALLFQITLFKMPSLIVAIAIAAAASSTRVAHANPTPIGSPGTTLMPFSLRHLPGVSIAEETLLIEDGKSEQIPSPAPGGKAMDIPCVQYQARYQFQNMTGKPVKIAVGFPVIAYSFVAGGSNGGLTFLNARYGNTTLIVNETRIPKSMVFPKHMVSKILADLKSANVVKNVAESPDFVDLGRLGTSAKSALAVLLNSRKLSQKQLKQCLSVLDEIAFANGDFSVTGQSLIWYTFEIPLPKGKSETMTVSYKSAVPLGEDYSFSYILTTAKFWNNKPGSLKVEIEPDREFVKAGGRYQVFPKDKFSNTKTGRFVFESKNKTPAFDIYVKRISHDSKLP
jgi:hypothetical protein